MRSKKIIINNGKDYIHFLRRLPFYKSIFYFHTSFVLENNTDIENINFIIQGLNIKRRKKRIEYVYDTSCQIIDEKVKGINICGFQNGKCYVQRKKKNGTCNGCCRKCLYQSNKGCTTKNFACKLFNCSEVTSRHEVVCYNDIKLLKLLSLKNRCVVKSDYFSKREDVLKDLYAFTLTYSTIRILYRLLRNSILFSRRRKNIDELPCNNVEKV